MKKLFNLLLLFVCVAHMPTYAQTDAQTEVEEDSILFESAEAVGEGRGESLDLVDEIDAATLYRDQAISEVYDFLAAEIASKREDWESAKEHYDALLERNSDPKVLERRIRLDLEAGSIADALPLIQKLVIQNPQNLANYNLLAQAYLLTGDIEYAARTYNHLVEMIYLTNNGVVEPSPYFAILKKLHEFEIPLDEQLALFKKMAALEEHDTFPLVLLAGFLIDNLRFDEAEGYLERALQLDPSNPKIYALYTYIYWNEGEPEKSILLLEEAYNKYQDPEIGLELANALIANFEYEEAYQRLIPLMILTNEDPAVFEKFIGMAYVMGNYDNIKEMLQLRLDQPEILTRAILNLFYFSEVLGNSENLLKVLPEIENPTAEYAEALYTIKAKVALAEGDYDQFNHYFEKIADLELFDAPSLLLKRLLMLQEMDEYDLLDQVLVEEAALLPEVESSYLAFLRSMSALYHQEYGEMVAILQEEIRNNPQDPIAYNALGYSLIEIDPKNAKVALPFISKANLMLPGRDFIQDSLAWAYYMLGDLERAHKYIVQAYHQNKDPEIIAHYIVILDAIGEREKAEDLYHRFNLFFGNSDAKEALIENVEWISE